MYRLLMHGVLERGSDDDILKSPYLVSILTELLSFSLGNSIDNLEQFKSAVH